jgi:hypothetical protein
MVADAENEKMKEAITLELSWIWNWLYNSSTCMLQVLNYFG